MKNTVKFVSSRGIAYNCNIYPKKSYQIQKCLISMIIKTSKMATRYMS